MTLVQVEEPRTDGTGPDDFIAEVFTDAGVKAVVNLPRKRILKAKKAIKAPVLKGEVVKRTKTGRIICISGFADSSRDMANRLPKDVEIWGLNRCYTYLKRWDRHYEVHEKELTSGQTGQREGDYFERLTKTGMPIYMQHPDPALPHAKQLPTQEMIAHFERDYFTTSIAYMIAHAVYEHDLGDTIKELKMFGVDMSAYSEYSFQRPCVEYWLGVAEGRGIKVTIPNVSPVLKAVTNYGRHGERVLWTQASERMAMHKGNIAQLGANVQATVGAAQEYTRVDSPIKLMQQINEEISVDVIKHLKKDELVAFMVEFYVAAEQSDAKMTARHQELQNALPQVQADLNAAMGAQRECQHFLTSFGAPQSEAEEPDVIRMPK